jgi:hypothetical protein
MGAATPARRSRSLSIKSHPTTGPSAMPLDNAGAHRAPAPSYGRVQDADNAEQLADAVVAVWCEIDQALHPIIGHRGVAALYNRSLKLTAATFPWLAQGHAGALAAVDATALRATLVQQAPAEAAAAGSALFETFRGLLASLLGDSLTQRLLHAVWDHTAGASPAQDDSK